MTLGSCSIADIFVVHNCSVLSLSPIKEGLQDL